MLQAAIQWGQPVPDYIRNAPKLLPGLELYSTAFRQLSTCRPMGFGPGSIPWHLIEKWGTLQELSQDQMEALHFHMERMDGVYLEYMAKKTEKS